MRLGFLVPVLFATLVLSPVSTLAQNQDGERDWLESYYENPTPEQFVSHMKDWAADGTLENEHAKPALIAFVSQVIRQNRAALEGWYHELAGLSPQQMQVMHTAMLYSRTAEADEILRETFGRSYDEQKRETQKILELPLDKQRTMDMLWGFFYATGSEEAIRRIVVGFVFTEAPERPPGLEIPEGHVPVYKLIPEFAFRSLVANGRRHPKIVEALRTFLESGNLVKAEEEGVRRVLSEIDPKAFPPAERENPAA